MKVISATSPQYTEDGSISLLVTFEGLGQVPFTASPADVEPHGRDLHDRAVAGEFGPVASAAVEPLPAVKARKLVELSRALDAALDTLTVTVAGKTYNASARMRERVSNAVNRAARGKPIKPTLLDVTGDTISVTVAQLQAIEDAMTSAAEALEDTFAAKVAQVKAATTTELVNAINW